MTDPEDRLDPTLVRLALILVAGALAPLLDSTIVNVAIATLGRDLHTSLAAIQWVITGYLLALAMAIPATGWLVGRFGAKRMWLFSLALFLAGSMLCGVAWNVGSLIAFRVLQGAGGGLMLPIMQTLLLRAAGGRALGRLMATISIPALVGPVLGPVIGGLIVGGASWRWIFYVNLPVCAVALVLAWRGLPADAPRGGQRPRFPPASRTPGSPTRRAGGRAPVGARCRRGLGRSGLAAGGTAAAATGTKVWPCTVTGAVPAGGRGRDGRRRAAGRRRPVVRQKPRSIPPAVTRPTSRTPGSPASPA